MRPPILSLEKPQRLSDHQWPQGTVPLLTIICATYNHEEFLEECIEGFLMQETTFPVEIVIHDDASSDSTGQIIRAYHARYPTLFRPILQTENQMQAGKDVFSPLYDLARGKYVALCEGDDYWSVSSKLEQQIAFLEAHPAFSQCLHNSIIIAGGTRQLAKTKTWDVCHTRAFITEFTDFTRDALVCPAHTSSLVVRKSALPNVRSVAGSWICGDLPLMILASECGPAKFLDSTMSVYRVHAAGKSSSGSHSGVRLLEGRLHMYAGVYGFLRGADNRAACREVMSTYGIALSKGLREEGRYAASLRVALKTLAASDYRQKAHVFMHYLRIAAPNPVKALSGITRANRFIARAIHIVKADGVYIAGRKALAKLNRYCERRRALRK